MSWLILYFNESIKLAIWKRRKCSNCHQKFGFRENDFGDWNNKYIVYFDKEENEEIKQYSGIKCPHCGEVVFQKKASSFDTKI